MTINDHNHWNMLLLYFDLDVVVYHVDTVDVLFNGDIMILLSLRMLNLLFSNVENTVDASVAAYASADDIPVADTGRVG